MLLVPPSRVYRPPPGGVGQFQTPFSMGVGGLILAAMLLTQNPSAALAVLPRSNPAAACPDRPAPPLPPAPPTLEGQAARGLGVVLGAGVVPLGVVAVLIKAELLASQEEIIEKLSGKLPKDLVNITDRAQLHLHSRAATEKLRELTVEGQWNEDKTILRVTAFFIKGKIKHAPSSILDPRSGLDFDLRFGVGAAEPLVLCVVMGTTILDKRDVSDLVLDGVQIVGGAEVCLRLPAITPRPVPPLLRESVSDLPPHLPTLCHLLA
jgi:hypothetical protein